MGQHLEAGVLRHLHLDALGDLDPGRSRRTDAEGDDDDDDRGGCREESRPRREPSLAAREAKPESGEGEVRRRDGRGIPAVDLPTHRLEHAPLPQLVPLGSRLGDLRQPCPKTTWIPEVADALPGRQKGLLDDLVEVAIGAEQPMDQSGDASRVMAVERPKMARRNAGPSFFLSAAGTGGSLKARWNLRGDGRLFEEEARGGEAASGWRCCSRRASGGPA